MKEHDIRALFARHPEWKTFITSNQHHRRSRWYEEGP